MPNPSSRRWVAPEGERKKTMGVMMKFMQLPRVDLYSETALEDLNHIWDEYTKTCEEWDYAPSRESFAVALKLPCQTLTKLINGTKGGKPLAKEVHEALLLMDGVMLATTADGMMNGVNNTIGAMFELKNHWGYRDQTEVVTLHKNESLTQDELQKLADSLPDVIDGEYHEVRRINEKN